MLVNGVSLKLISMPNKEVPEGYLKRTFDYDNNKIEGYQFVQKGVTYAADDKVKGSSFYLLYAVNEETGKKGLYVYDKEENTIQRYNPDLILAYQNKLDKTNFYLYISLGVIGVLLIVLSTILIKKGKDKKKRR